MEEWKITAIAVVVAFGIKLLLFLLTALQTYQRSKAQTKGPYQLLQTGSNKSGKKVVVLGGCGFLGRCGAFICKFVSYPQIIDYRHVVALLDERLRSSTHVVVMDLAARKVAKESLNPRVTYIVGDITIPTHVNTVVAGAAAVVHVVRGEHLAHVPAPPLRDLNTKGTHAVVEAALEGNSVHALVYASSVNVLWHQQKADTKAAAPEVPGVAVSTNALLECGGSMAAAERLVLGANGPAVRSAIIRTGWLYGRDIKGQLDMTHGFSPLVAAAPGAACVPLTDVCDVARALVAALVCLTWPEQGPVQGGSTAHAGPLLQAARAPWSGPQAVGSGEEEADAAGAETDPRAANEKPALTARPVSWVSGKVLHVCDRPAGHGQAGSAPLLAWPLQACGPVPALVAGAAAANLVVARSLGVAPLHRSLTPAAVTAAQRSLVLETAHTDILMGGAGWHGPGVCSAATKGAGQKKRD